MKKAEVKIGQIYLAKVSGKIVPLRVVSLSPYGGWLVINRESGRKLHIKSARRFRAPYPDTR